MVNDHKTTFLMISKQSKFTTKKSNYKKKIKTCFRLSQKRLEKERNGRNLGSKMEIFKPFIYIYNDIVCGFLLLRIIFIFMKLVHYGSELLKTTKNTENLCEFTPSDMF